MSLISLVVVLIMVGILLWGLNQVDQIDPGIKKIINIVVFVAVALWILSMFFNLGGLPNPHIGR